MIGGPARRRLLACWPLVLALVGAGAFLVHRHAAPVDFCRRSDRLLVDLSAGGRANDPSRVADALSTVDLGAWARTVPGPARPSARRLVRAAPQVVRVLRALPPGEPVLRALPPDVVRAFTVVGRAYQRRCAG